MRKNSTKQHIDLLSDHGPFAFSRSFLKTPKLKLRTWSSFFWLPVSRLILFYNLLPSTEHISQALYWVFHICQLQKRVTIFTKYATITPGGWDRGIEKAHRANRNPSLEHGIRKTPLQETRNCGCVALKGPLLSFDFFLTTREGDFRNRSILPD